MAERQKLYLALGAVGAFLLALRLVMRSRAASDFIVHRSYSHTTGQWDGCAVCAFSVAELCWAVLVCSASGMWAAQCGCWHVGADGGWQCCGGVRWAACWWH
ncbi:MAG: hypothetical protein ACLR7U_00455 [Ruthenibacterium lactatiformans]